MDATTLNSQAERFLAELHRSPQTVRAYRADLRHLTGWLRETAHGLEREALEAYFAVHPHWAPATRSRKQTTLERFCRWALQHDLLDRDPTLHLEHPRLPPPHPRGLRREDIERIFAVIPPEQARDALLFRLVFETGLRIGEALGIHVEDLDLTRGDEHLTVLGKGSRKRTVLLDDPRLVSALRRYLRTLGYTHGPLFQATKNGRGGPLRYQSVQERWQGYARRAGVTCTLHQLRHSHATELVNGGVSLATIRKRLGHQHIQTTLRYAEVSDSTADAELRRWRRQRH
ncbi:MULTISPECIES: tyrosine-type recombinase/integrase [Deinococcus]|uniref:Site-specific recombinase XerD n=2 Tax=Deinococcus soli (ex Cha et al. 2016) TaxID=1309411 RepID=A0ACC6KQI0_9DEIO|nr:MULTISPECIES: tyrosine-type recombinase/integrase [Deinococcus]MDK2014728.1 tyrosine-type recombinase/integrase [Deinococcus sp. 43]MDR6221513.1 site-specific recombinase XerD [Deinococcus soli (ex Cha et al. 2016)]MDR6331495.1 site-specific recombinase XerD [Deinococcus soli (ex Cha et al. 2016)]MDR6754660.1 site-specific recombinase XerD [Deinococcus soli (ex Cha et al. 2016)]